MSIDGVEGLQALLRRMRDSGAGDLSSGVTLMSGLAEMLSSSFGMLAVGVEAVEAARIC